jgi:glycosyltransferase involved in cell wall biosynthesis
VSLRGRSRPNDGIRRTRDPELGQRTNPILFPRTASLVAAVDRHGLAMTGGGPPLRREVDGGLAFALVRVLVDARPAVDPHPTGVGHYTRALLRHLPLADPETDFVAWYLDARGSGRGRRRFAGWAPNLVERASRIPARVFGPVSVRLGLPKVEQLAGRSDLVVATNFLPPPTSNRGTVMVVHDLAFEVLPETAPHHNDRWRRLFDACLRRAAAVILPSEAARADLLRLHGGDPDRAIAIHHGTDTDAFTPASPHAVQEIRRRYGIGGRYVLFLGGLEPRKNLAGLVRAFGILEDPGAWLVVAGGPVRWAPGYADRVDRAIDELPGSARDRVVRTGYVGHAERRALLSGAEVLAYPSLHEGFGFPILEGFASRVPVLTSNVSSMPEVAGDAATLVDPEDPIAIARGLDELLGDEDLRNALRASGATRMASFTWERCARETVAVLRGAYDRLHP